MRQIERAITLKGGAEHVRAKAKVGVANRTWLTQDRERDGVPDYESSK